MKKSEKVLVVIWILLVCSLLLMIGYYIGHYCYPHYTIKYVPIIKNIPLVTV